MKRTDTWNGYILTDEKTNKIVEKHVDNGITEIVYDRKDRIIKIADKYGNSTRYIYQDNKNIKITIKQPSGFKTVQKFDNRDRIVEEERNDGKWFKREYGLYNKVMYYEDETGVKIKDGKSMYPTERYNVVIKPI